MMEKQEGEVDYSSANRTTATEIFGYLKNHAPVQVVATSYIPVVTIAHVSNPFNP